MKRLFSILVILGVVCGFAGCSSTGNKQSANANGVGTMQAANAGNQVATQGMGANANFSGQNNAQANAAMTPAQLAQARENIIYFAFNSSQVTPKYVAILQAQANYLTRHPRAQVKLEGNTDKPGSREYNIALGSWRTQAVAQRLEQLGARSNQITQVSFGREYATGPAGAQNQQDRNVKFDY